MNTETIRTLIVDDHAVVRSGYRSYLEQVPGFQVVAEADCANEAYAQYKRMHPDVVIMDIMLQGASGFDALSPREFEIFLLLISGAPVKEIAQALNLSAKTVANRASMIRQKLGVS